MNHLIPLILSLHSTGTTIHCFSSHPPYHKYNLFYISIVIVIKFDNYLYLFSILYFNMHILFLKRTYSLNNFRVFHYRVNLNEISVNN